MTTWGRGDYPSMAATLVDAAREAVQWAEVRPGEHVLDLGTGTGNAALLAAAEGGEVVAVDFEPALVAEAERRAARAGLRLDWRVADVAATGLPDGWADVVLSLFGVMYGGDHEAALREICRCVDRPGRVVLAAWQPSSFLAAFGAAVAPFVSRPPEWSTPPSSWGNPAWLDEQAARAELTVEEHRTRDVKWSFRDAESAAAFFISTAGHVVDERANLERAGRWNELEEAVVELVTQRGVVAHGALEIDGAYLLTRLVASPRVRSRS